jgi:adenine-specific DNA-methyltransferase
MHGRKAYGVDREEEYIKIGGKRLELLLSGRLETRPMGKPVYKPTGRETISQIPMEWTKIDGSAYNP